MRKIELELTRFRGSLIDFEEEVRFMQTKLEKDHKDFLANRQRWKSDFLLATAKADSAFEKIDTTVKSCYT